MRQFLTIDTGGTKTRIVQFDAISHASEAYLASVLREVEIPTPRDKDKYIAEVVDAIKQNFSEFCKSPEENVVILATRGVVRNNVLIIDPLLGWHNFDIAGELSPLLGDAKILVQNDARMGTVGAFPPDFRGRGLFITIGTGIGGGLIIDDELSHDVTSFEPGHMVLDSQRSWEDSASATAWFEHSGGRSGHDVSADDLIWRWYAEALAAGIVILLPILYPDIIMIGGRMAEFFDKYADDLRRVVSERAWPPVAQVKISAVSDPHYLTNRGALIFGLKQMEKIDEN